MLINALRLWKDRHDYKSSTLQSRLILFFSLLLCSILLLFTLLLLAFGITGSEQSAVQRYFKGELSHISASVENDFDHISATGIRLAESISDYGDRFFDDKGITASELSASPEIIDELLAGQMNDLISVSEYNACGGVFIIFDASSSGNASQSKKSGFFLKKTQPISSAALMSKSYCLRGPAAIARSNGIELLGQWQMQYDESELEFFQSVIKTARENPELPLSRLYHWSDRVCLNGNSENGLLLCVPLRSVDGTVWGICGLEVSDRMFKKLYSPDESELQGVFSIVAPRDERAFYADRGLLAGNSYLTEKQMTGELTLDKVKHGFRRFYGSELSFGGLSEDIRLYSVASPYIGEKWAVVALMPESLLQNAVKGNSTYLFFIVAGSMILSLAASVFVSKRYLQPIKRGLSSLREKGYETGTPDFGIFEIDSLFEELALSIREHKAELERLSLEKQDAEARFVEAQLQIERLADKRKQEIELDDYAHFLESLTLLTATERKIFDLYLAGKTTDEILEALQIKQNTLKYHNRNIYGKLGVTSRKQLLAYAAVIQQENGSAFSAKAY